jgi:large subunit ribosomal protein L25
MEPVLLDVQDRSTFGKKLGTLRRSNITPLHVYGLGLPSLSLQVDTSAMLRTLAQVGRTSPLIVRVNGEEHFVMVREVQRHPVTDRLLHVDLIQVSRTQRMRAAVPVLLQGTAPAANQAGAMVVHDLHAIQVEALPLDLPSSLSVDISGLTEVDTGIYVRDVQLPEGVEPVTDLSLSIVRVVRQRATEGGEQPSAAAEVAAAATTDEGSA